MGFLTAVILFFYPVTYAMGTNNWVLQAQKMSNLREKIDDKKASILPASTLLLFIATFN